MSKLKQKSKLKKESVTCYIVLIILAAVCILPLLLVLSASFTDESYITKNGYSLLPVDPTLDTYRFLVSSKGKMLVKAFGVTVLSTALGTLLNLTVCVSFAYAITQPKSVFRFSRKLSFLGWFATIFSGGVVPWYILCTQYYGLKNNIWALTLPYCMSMYYVFILRSNFRQIPAEIIESAELDGASHSRIFFNIVIPLAKSGIVTIALFDVFMFWNDFYLPQWLITNPDWYTLQKVLYDMLASVKSLMMDSDIAASVLANVTLPTNTAKMAVTVLTLIPIILIYPFSLRYFVKGINVGGVKG